MTTASRQCFIRTAGKEVHDDDNTVIPRLTSDPANEFFG